MIIRGGENDIIENGKLAGYESQHYKSDFTVGLVLILCYFIITIIMMKGALEYRSGLLLPFFCLQLFDFFITLLTSVHLMSYYPQLEYEEGMTSDKFPNDQEFMHWKENLGMVDNESRWFVFIALVMFLCIMTSKVYCIVCVWACYQHIVSVEAGEYQACMTEDPEVMDPLKPPCYNDALKDSVFKPPPPPYLDFH
ncbi:putative lysosomal-associated transmembrane protein 4A [Apostichopus japonicus]|uniref:Putative lysosomal-associated transmembrane protein 4A n=1 Tax=Stichopus japonicus TaxID=307972 RepID=A0A2G8JVG1_STIJA|nr:putative lysosomal-associated transmembrane protein 4A [Apostichopus japonicus]